MYYVLRVLVVLRVLPGRRRLIEALARRDVACLSPPVLFQIIDQ